MIDLKELQQELKGIEFGQAGAALRAMDAGTISIIRLNIDDAPVAEPDVKFFFKQITAAENQALVSIIKEFDGKNNGIVRISQLVEKHNLSRPVYTSLLKKMEEYEIAEIKTHGAKGTEINFLVSSTNKLL